MSGTALGWFPKGEAITGERLECGDLLIGLPSSGIHSNGYTLVRAIVERSGHSLIEEAPFDTSHPGREIERFPDSEGEISLGEVLLNPTRIYVDPVVDLILECRGGSGPCELSDIKAIAHITGGGLSNLLRLHDSLGWHIETPLPLIQSSSGLPRVGLSIPRRCTELSTWAWEWLLQCPRDVLIPYWNGFQRGAWSQYSRFGY